jgi:hypothetical protein
MKNIFFPLIVFVMVNASSHVFSMTPDLAEKPPLHSSRTQHLEELGERTKKLSEDIAKLKTIVDSDTNISNDIRDKMYQSVDTYHALPRLTSLYALSGLRYLVDQVLHSNMSDRDYKSLINALVHRSKTPCFDDDYRMAGRTASPALAEKGSEVHPVVSSASLSNRINALRKSESNVTVPNALTSSRSIPLPIIDEKMHQEAQEELAEIHNSPPKNEPVVRKNSYPTWSASPFGFSGT